MSLDTYGDRQLDLKKRTSEYEAAYEENKDYFKLVELIFDTRGKDCKRNGAKCDVYKEFEKQHILEFDGTDKCTNCRFSYKG